MNYQAFPKIIPSSCIDGKTPHASCCVVFRDIINAIKLYDMHLHQLVIEIFLNDCIQAILNSGVEIYTTTKISIMFI